MKPVIVDGCFGWLHAPASGASSDVAVVLCPGLSQDGSTGHRSFRLLADRLAAAGYPTLRFDYPGTGDSRDVDFEAYWEAWPASIDAAADWLRAHVGGRRIVLIGLRFGATLAGIVAGRRDDVAGLVLLAPVVRGRSYVSQLVTEARLRHGGRLLDDDGIEVGELRLRSDTLAQMREASLSAVPLTAACKVLVGARGESKVLTDCVQSWREAGLSVVSSGFEAFEALLRPTHLTDEPDADFSSVIEWLDGALPRGTAQVAALCAPVRPTLQLAGCVETALVFGAQRNLCGILCRPTNPVHGDLAVVIGNTGGNPHHGFARFSVEFARSLARAGITSLRMDFAGLGDSAHPTNGGEGPTHVFEVDRTSDTRDAVNELERLGYKRFAAQGLCSGAYHAFHAAVADPRFCAVLLVNLPWFTLRHEAPGPSSFPRRSLRALTERQVRTLFLFAEGDAGLKSLERHFGQGGLALSGFAGVTVSVVPGFDHELTGSAMRSAAADRMLTFLRETDRHASRQLSPVTRRVPAAPQL